MSLITYPLNDIDYTAEDAELFHCTRSSGVHARNSFTCTCTGTDNKLTIGPGIAWIHNSDYSGKVVALKSDLKLSLSVPDATYPRIDTVILMFNAATNKSSIGIRAGTAASSPVPTTRSMTASLYELHLYHIRREPGATAVTAADITDLRLDSAYCGLMADSVTKIDTTAINSQVRGLIADLEKQIASKLEAVDKALNTEYQMGVPIPSDTQDGYFLRALSGGYQLVDFLNLYVWKKYSGQPEASETSKSSQWLCKKYSSSSNGNTAYQPIHYADEISITDNGITLLNPTTISSPTVSSLETVKGKYIYAEFAGDYFRIPSNATFKEASSSYGTAYSYIYVSTAYLLTMGGTKVGYATSEASDTYPQNGEHTDGYWYIYHKQMGD